MAGDGVRVGLANLVHLVRTHPLAREHQLATVGRIARWQVASRLWGNELVVPFVGESQMVVNTSMHGATGNYYAGLLEYEQMAFTMHLLRPEDLFADVGANVGAYTILAGAAVGARTVAVEPTAAASRVLRRNVAINGVEGHVRIVQQAASDGPGTLSLSLGDDATTHVVVGAGDASVELVQADTLDHILGGQVPRLIKIDVEGWERSVLLGATSTLADADLWALLVETNDLGEHYGVASQDIDELLGDHGFEKVSYDPRTRTLGERQAGSGDPNTIFVRDREQVAERLRTAPTYRVAGEQL